MAVPVSLTICVNDVLSELEFATNKFGSFHNDHEGYAVILEEMDELWEEIKAKKGTRRSRYNEAKQVAAMALRFMSDLGKE